MDAASKAQAARLKSLNPCHDESATSLRCLNEQLGDSEACKNEIANYKKCKQFWYDIYNFRKLHGIRPFQPVGEEAATIKANFLKSNKNLKKTCDDILLSQAQAKSLSS